jgi:hypothetical protein
MTGARLIGFVEAVDEVETAGAARTCAGGEAAGKLSFGARRERSGLLVTHMDPLDCAAVDGVSDLVQRVAHDPVAPLYARRSQRFNQNIGHSLGHCGTSSVVINKDRLPAEFCP